MTDNLQPPLVVIETRYLGPTNHKPSRIVAETCNGHRLVVPYYYEGICGAYDAHRRAAMMLADKMKWAGTVWHGGGTKAGYVFVQVFA
jgi:hypothetical protein